MNNLVILILGHRDSGKSTTWNDLFRRIVRTGTKQRRLYLRSNEYVEVFLVSGSPEERESYVGDIIGSQRPRIVLCSMQYRQDVARTIDFFIKNEYQIYCQWLNPGYNDVYGTQLFDRLGLINFLLSHNSIVTIQNGKERTDFRVQMIKEHIYGWATFRNLIKKE